MSSLLPTIFWSSPIARSSSRASGTGTSSSAYRSRPTRADARVTDAWYAALAIEWGCEWITFDRDYARFPGLKWRTPEAA